MEAKTKKTKKFILTKVLPIMLFILTTASVVSLYYNQLSNAVGQLSHKYVAEELELYSICIGNDMQSVDKYLKNSEFADVSWFVLLDGQNKIVCSYNGSQVKYIENNMDFAKLVDISSGNSSSVLYGIEKHRSGNGLVTFGADERHVFYHYNSNNNLTAVLGIENAYFEAELAPYNKTIRNMLLSLLGCIILYMLIVIMNTLIDKSSGKKKSEGLKQLAETDQLTGLYNKVTTERKIKEYIEENPDSQGVLFILDIDNFKKINDTMGHAFGDEVLREIGIGLKSQFRASDIIGRAGGDEFIILLKNLKEDEYIIREAQKLENFFRGLQVGTYTKYSVTSSIGCSIFSRDGDSFEKLYKQADEALYKAKQRGKNQLAFYNDIEGFGQNV